MKSTKSFLTASALTVFAAIETSAIVIPSTCESALRRAMDGDAAWRMERTIAGAARPLVSTGLVHTVSGEGIVWDVRWPFESKIVMSTNSMTFADDEGERTKKLSELPHYAEIRKETDKFLSGDPKAFEGAFRVETLFTDDGKWKLVFVPEARAVRRIVSRAELTGDSYLETVVLESADGSFTSVTFTPLQNVK